jgi:8-oxo-dGTP pyrophosphatase MutT (NUDIX family)
MRALFTFPVSGASPGCEVDVNERIRKASAIVLRGNAANPWVLVFDHPLDEGLMVQVPAGTVEPNEEPQAAAVRELFEESGIRGAAPTLAAVRPSNFTGCYCGRPSS